MSSDSTSTSRLRFVIQHEFDHEPTYIAPANTESGDFVTLGAALPPEQRRALAAHIKAFLERPIVTLTNDAEKALPLRRCRDFSGEFNGACPHDVHECAGTFCNGCKAFPDLCSCGSNGQRVRGGTFAAPLADLRFPAMFFCPHPEYSHTHLLSLTFDAIEPPNSIKVTTEDDLCAALDAGLRVPATAITVAVFGNNRVASAYAEGASDYDDVNYAQIDDPLTGLSYLAVFNEETDEVTIRHEDRREL